MTLRPIGTTFEIEYPPLDNSTEKVFTIITYKVKDHVKADRFIGDKEGHIVEEIEPIEYRKIPAILINECIDGKWIQKWERIK